MAKRSIDVKYDEILKKYSGNDCLVKLSGREKKNRNNKEFYLYMSLK